MTESTDLQASATLRSAHTGEPNDLELRVTITNASPRPVRFNALFLPYTTSMMRVERSDGTRVAPGPPPPRARQLPRPLPARVRERRARRVDWPPRDHVAGIRRERRAIDLPCPRCHGRTRMIDPQR